ncbi:TspO/MBR family protein [Flavobacterium terrigena]|uniref:TspO and MBR related proteins n=1 Tax=Flavobacterium terrigena TaxID=402734 RepID=A0A1H6XGI5_9FLAO|nr:TspO/MBR family protein [Flavobacterium terrigena]SEJ25787.1 TspO and MBR related proteins [Flavobacterium terrigena]
MKKYLRISYCIIICLTIGFFSGKITQSSITTWYPTLVKPIFNPPNWIFAPVWTLLYIGMGIAAGLIWNEIENQQKQVKIALQYFVLQLGLNALWSYLFFSLHNLLLASIEIILLLLIIIECYKLFKPINPIAAKLFIPYIAWVSFATLLTLSIFYLNNF